MLFFRHPVTGSGSALCIFFYRTRSQITHALRISGIRIHACPSPLPPLSKSDRLHPEPTLPEANSITDLAPPSLEDSSTRWHLWTPRIIALLTFAVLLPLYYHVAMRRVEKFNSEDTKLLDHFAGEKKTNVIFHHDQHVYLNLGRLLRLSDYEYVIPRHRMPGYPLLLSLLYSDNDAYEVDPNSKDSRRVSEGYFNRAKQFNIWLSMALIVGLFFFLVCYLPIIESLMSVWAIAWLIFVYKACFVQPEILYDTLSVMLVILMWRQIDHPTWRRGIVTGLVLAAAYFIKSALLPLTALFVACFAIKMIANGILQWRTRGETTSAILMRRWCLDVGRGAIVPVIWLALLSPYLYNTWKFHGSPFWSIHSAHYFWLETPEDKKTWQGLAELALDEEVPADAPTREKYFATHSLGEIVHRFVDGAATTINNIRIYYRETDRFLFHRLGRACLYIGIIFLFPIIRKSRLHFAELLFLGGFMIGYGLLFGWFEPIHAGLRFMLSLYPMAIVLGLWFLNRHADSVQIPRAGIQIHTRAIVMLALAISLASSIHEVVTKSAWKIEGGN